VRNTHSRACRQHVRSNRLAPDRAPLPHHHMSFALSVTAPPIGKNHPSMHVPISCSLLTALQRVVICRAPTHHKPKAVKSHRPPTHPCQLLSALLVRKQHLCRRRLHWRRSPSRRWVCRTQSHDWGKCALCSPMRPSSTTRPCFVLLGFLSLATHLHAHARLCCVNFKCFLFSAPQVVARRVPPLSSTLPPPPPLASPRRQTAHDCGNRI
jgi:hypothetical protein